MRTSLIIVFIFSFMLGRSQSSGSTAYNDFWTANKRGMISLTTWSTANIASSLVLNSQLSGEMKHFSQMNGMWNLVNLGLAVPGWVKSARKLQYPDMESWNVDKLRLPKIYKVNFYLDFFYIGAGTTMSLLANRTNNSELIGGFGKSVLLQGSYLLVFDLVMHRLLKKKVNL